MASPKSIGPPGPGQTKLVGERRQVTVLFYDIVNSTLLLNSLDPEDFGELQRVIHLTAAAIIERNGGHLERIAGDGGCAFFGYPVATEDAAECAVRTALEVIRSCDSQQDLRSSELQIRIGVATGTIVVNELAVGLPERRELIGLPLNLAARLEANAAPGTVLVSETTYRLTHAAFQYHPVGPIELKGFSELQRAWRPVAAEAMKSRFETFRRPGTPFVARFLELEVGRNCWTDARAGNGRVLALIGEAGIGKSRMVAEMLRQTSSDDCDRKLFQCQPRGNRRPFHPIVDRLHQEIRRSAADRGISHATVRDYISSTAPEASFDSVEVISFLSTPARETAPSNPVPIEVPSADFGHAAVDAMLDVLAAWCRLRPQILVLEDFHWADELTRELVTKVIRRIGSMRALLVITSRKPIEPSHSNHPSVIAWNLSRLGSQDIPHLVEAIWAPQSVPQGLPAFIEERSEGVPLFVEELSHFLRERLGGMPSTKPDWEALLRQEGVLTLKDLLTSRIAATGRLRRVAQTASVIGREFSFDLLADICPEIGEETLRANLDGLLKKNVIERFEGSSGATFRFYHALYQDVAYGSLLKAERHELHARVVEAVEHREIATLNDDIMAWHCEQAGLFESAARYAIRAAESCAARSAIREAYDLLTSASSCLAQVASSTSGDDLTLRLLATRGPVEMALFGSGSPEACRTYEEAVQICRRKGDTDKAQWFPLYWGWWITSPNSEAVARSRTIVADLGNTPDQEIRLQSLHCAWATHFHAGNHRECLHCIEQGLELYDPERAVLSRTKYGGHDAKVCGLAERGQALWFVGERSAAAESIKVAVEWAEETRHLGSLCHALDVALLFNHFERNLAEVLRLSQRVCELGRQHGLPNYEAKSNIFAGWAQALSGDVSEGMTTFEQGLEQQIRIGTEEDLPLYLDMKASILERAGHHDNALAAIVQAIDDARRTSNEFWLPELLRRRAILEAQCGTCSDVVIRHLKEALFLARRHGAETLARRAVADLANAQKRADRE
jgi:class 3 adenylate cyclase/predicted ATPase